MKRFEYLNQFAESKEAPNRQKEALKQALDIRKFEIDTYWKRATYFWACIAVAYAGFFALSASARPDHKAAALVGCVGFLFSLGWYLVNRGSSSWQRNWELQVDLLEDEVMGPLYKTHIDRRRHRFWDLAGPFSFSPSRVNTILSLVVTISWLMLFYEASADALKQPGGCWYVPLMGSLALAGAAALLSAGRARKEQGSRTFDAHSRSYE